MTTLSNATKNIAEVIYLVSEALDNYLIGASENETLITFAGNSLVNQAKT